jgi:hypothetical protein
MSFEIGTDDCASFWSGPPSPNRNEPDPDRDPVEHDRRDHLVRADRRLQEARDAGPRRAGERRDDDRERDVQERVHAVERRADPHGQIAPTMYWPWPPMLNRPQRKANATARPVRIERRRDDQRLLQVDAARLESYVPREPDLASLRQPIRVPDSKNHESPAPSKIARYVVTGSCPSSRARRGRRRGTRARRQERREDPSARWATP